MCTNCRNSGNTCTDYVSSDCVTWQGDGEAELDVCINDSLTEVGNIVLTKIKNLLKGRGIILEDLTVTDCEYIKDLLGVDEKNLLNILNVYKEAICDLKLGNKSNGDQLAAFTTVASYTLGCLNAGDPCDGTITFKSLVQAIITKVCELDTQLAGVATGLLDIVEESTGNFLVNGAVKSSGGSGIKYTGSGATAQVVIEALVPPNCPVLFTGSTASFDSNGVGLPNSDYAGWYLCNGANGTPNATTLPQNGDNSLKYIIRLISTT